MAELTSERKLEIVQALAQFTKPAEVSAMLKTAYGEEISIQQIVVYDPTKAGFRAAQSYRKIFDETRKAYLEQVSQVPIANQGYRLQILQISLDKALAGGNLVLSANILKQAAEEVGGVLTNDKRVTLNDERDRGYKDLTPDERRDMFTQMLIDAVAEDGKQNASTTETTQ